MIADLMLGIAVKTSIVSAIGALCVAGLKTRSAADRAMAAHAALTATAVTPLFTLFIPSLEFDLPSLVWPLPSSTRSTIWAEAAVSDMPASISSLYPALALAMYGLVAMLLLGGLVLGLVRLFRLERGAKVLNAAPWRTALDRARRRACLKREVTLLLNRDLGAAASWGLLRPKVMVSDAGLASGDIHALIAHEVAHVARFDWASLLLTRVVTSLFWFSPFTWILAIQAHQAREEAADDLVMRADPTGGVAYASMLLKTARSTRGGVALANGLGDGSSLRKRVARVLSPSVRRTSAQGAWNWLIGAAALLVVAPTAACNLSVSPALEPIVQPIATSRLKESAGGHAGDRSTGPVQVPGVPARESPPKKEADANVGLGQAWRVEPRPAPSLGLMTERARNEAANRAALVEERARNKAANRAALLEERRFGQAARRLKTRGADDPSFKSSGQRQSELTIHPPPTRTSGVFA